jgi:hypothetical protein
MALESTKKSDWVCRRQEILKQVNQYIYGEKPPKPDSVTGTVTTTQVTVNVTENGQNASFTAAVTVPAGRQAPFPAIVSYGGNGGVTAIVAAMGVAVINFNQGSVGSRNTGIYSRLYPNNTSGDLAAGLGEPAASSTCSRQPATPSSIPRSWPSPAAHSWARQPWRPAPSTNDSRWSSRANPHRWRALVQDRLPARAQYRGQSKRHDQSKRSRAASARHQQRLAACQLPRG